jgi:hypothetical protein
MNTQTEPAQLQPFEVGEHIDQAIKDSLTKYFDLTPIELKRAQTISAFRVFRKMSGSEDAAKFLREAMRLDQELEAMEEGR